MRRERALKTVLVSGVAHCCSRLSLDCICEGRPCVGDDAEPLFENLKLGGAAVLGSEVRLAANVKPIEV